MTADLIEILTEPGALAGSKFILHLDGASYTMEDVSVTIAPTPVSRPAMRGGSYFAEKSACRLTCTVGDPLIAGALTGKMLGPSTEFEEIRMDAAILRGGKPTHLTIYAHLTDTVQRPDSIGLGMTIVKVRRAQP